MARGKNTARRWVKSALLLKAGEFFLSAAYWCSVAVTNCHKFNGLKQYKYVLQFGVLCWGGTHGAEMKVLAGLGSREAPGGICFLDFPASRGRPILPRAPDSFVCKASSRTSL